MKHAPFLLLEIPELGTGVDRFDRTTGDYNQSLSTRPYPLMGNRTHGYEPLLVGASRVDSIYLSTTEVFDGTVEQAAVNRLLSLEKVDTTLTPVDTRRAGGAAGVAKNPTTLAKLRVSMIGILYESGALPLSYVGVDERVNCRGPRKGCQL
jgi:hypothetical protein